MQIERPHSRRSIRRCTRIAKEIERGVSGARVSASTPEGEKRITKLIVRADDAQITPVLLGCVYEPAVGSVSAPVEEEFGLAEMPVVSFADLYAGQIVAALDRQHPRDLFRIALLVKMNDLSKSQQPRSDDPDFWSA